MSQFTFSPSFVPSAAAIARAQERRRMRRMFRDLAKGRWRRVLIDMKQTQHFFPDVMKNDGTFGAMLIKFNVFALALKWHAVVLVGNPIKITVPEANADQALAINQIRDRCLFDARLAQAVRLLNREAEAAFRIDNSAAGVLVVLEDNERTFPVGPDGPDGQPTAWDVRWIVERPDPRNRREKVCYLRIERHTTGRIEQLAFKCKGTDVLQDETKLERVALADAVGEEVAGSIVEVTETGLAYPAIVRLIADEEDAEPAFIISEDDLELFDTLAAAFSRLARTNEQHGDPRMRIVEGMIDPITGRVKSDRGILDPDKLVEYIQADFKLEQMMQLMDAVIEMALMMLQVSKGLVGLKEGSGAESYEAKLLDSSNTLARAHGTRMYVEPALGRVWTAASIIESRRPDRGFAVAPVSVQMRPEIPKSNREIIAEQREALEARLTSERRAIAAVHGDDQALQIQEEIAADDAARTARDRSALMMSMPTLGGGVA